MSYRRRTFAGLVTILLAAGCVRTVSDRPVVEVVSPSAPLPLAGHPAVTVTGVVATFDPSTQIFRLDDGRMVKLTAQSQIVLPVAHAIRAGDLVVLKEVLPIGVQSGVKTLAVGVPQRMGTVASVDAERGLVQLSDGTVVRVSRSTNTHLGAAGSNVALTQVSAGDEVVVLFDHGGLPEPASPTDEATVAPSALVRENATAPSPAPEAGELMVFRAPRRP